MKVIYIVKIQYKDTGIDQKGRVPTIFRSATLKGEIFLILMI
jgi:hypothetical protein